MNLNIFNTANLFEAATKLFHQLGIKLNSNTAEPISVKDLLKQFYKDNDTFNSIDNTYFIGIIDNTVFQATGMFDVNYSYKEALQQGDKNYDGLMLFALELSKQPTRTEISDLTRTFNRISQKMPVALVLKYKTENKACFSIAISERFKYKQNWRQGEKAGKVIILRDIHTETTHAGHERILLDLVKPVGVNNYDQLHQHWLQVLDVNILNKKFFQDLANWYFWAMDNVSFPDDLEKKKDVRNATNLIRLITRVVFIWFIKEKSLVPNSLFDKGELDKILKDFNKNKESKNYYNAILQNLFFGTLNQKMNEREFAEISDKHNKSDQGVKNKFRYSELFNIPQNEIKDLFKDVPFLNGGLFDCLDKYDEEKLERGIKDQIFVDGFTRIEKKMASIPDFIFFGEERDVDLNHIFGTKNKKYKTRGLINLLGRYKFTVAENTPLEEDVALDPELLGKVFENLLASYNPETQTTARKQTGSFYTPREIVNYMVDESLLEYIKQNVKTDDADFESRLRALISYSEIPNPFNEKETKALIEGINNCKILDPACGSGAYPMGILHKMVHLLQKLDPGNKLWKAQQKENIIGDQIKLLEKDRDAIKGLSDKAVREKAEKAVDLRLKEVDDIFESKNNFDDYARKLYLIENCIYGIDIQPIAVQISKLRFFISLIIDQNKQASKENFGIRSLPNLETKFVAANTLIGLDKPAQTLLRNPQIEEKENQLKELRHKYFTANTRKEKLQYQKQDKNLRQQIAKMLESDGWQTAVAKQIVAFDPYDQNTFAPWFDPEWMFGLTNGFDIVIGNPPYINIANLKPDEYRLALRNKFRSAKNKSDTYAFFIEQGFDLLKADGTLSYIIPQTWKATDSFSKLREIIFKEKSMSKIVDLEFGTFDAIVKPMVVVISNTKNKYNSIEIYDFNFNKISDIKIKEILSDSTLSINTTLNVRQKLVFEKLEKGSVTLGKIIQFSRGIKTSDDSRFIHTSAKSKDYKKVFRGKNIRAYELNWNGEYVWYRPDLMKEKVGSVSYSKDFFEVPEKLVTQRVNSSMQLLCAYDDNQNYFLDTTNLSRYETWDKKTSLKYLCAILNSKVINYWYCNKYLMPTIGIYEMHTIPIKKVKDQKPLISVVNFILIQKSNNIDTSFFERLIDAMVYELYLPEEIKAAGAEVLKYLNDLPELKEGHDEKNLKTVEKVYKELSDPKHPISAALLKLLTIEEVNIIEGRK